MHDQTSGSFIVSETLTGQKIVTTRECGVAKIDRRCRSRHRRRGGNVADDRVGSAVEVPENHALVGFADDSVPLLEVEYLAVEESVVAPVALAEKALTVRFQAWAGPS